MKILDRAARRILDRLQLAVRPGSTATRQGGHKSPVLASGVEFADHRHYVPGDDVRHIDWKAFARHGQLTIRQFEEERDARVYVMLDLSGSMSRGAPVAKIEMAKRLAAAFAYVGMRQFDRAMVMPFGDDLERETRPLRSAADLPEVDRFLTECGAGGPTSFAQSVRSLGERFPQRGLVVVVSDLMKPEGWLEGFRTIGALGHELRVVHVRCAEDLAPQFSGELELFDAEDQRTVRLRVSKDLLDAYRAEVEKHIAGCRDAARRAGGRFIDVPIDMPIELALRRAFVGQDNAKGAMRA
ncbi:MAG: DUF58 domain-containing protein [Myxococcota bacterium]|nr:DUF58 domain-containing protein [Myxococcota bacterium]